MPNVPLPGTVLWFLYTWHPLLYPGGIHNNPAKCWHYATTPRDCGHIHPCPAVN